MVRLSRRALLGSAGAAGLAAAAGGGGFALGRDGAPAAPDTRVVPFHGRHQAGIATPAQDRLQFAAFDAEPGARAGPTSRACCVRGARRRPA